MRTRLQQAIDAALRGAIERAGMGGDRARVALSLVPLFVPAMEGLIVELVRQARKKNGAD